MKTVEKLVFLISLVVFLISVSFVAYKFYDENKENRPAPDGTFSEGIIGEPGILNPLFADLNAYDKDATKLMFAGLVKYEPRAQKMVSDLAYYEVLDDGKKFRFEMKSDLKWSDGKAMTIDDAVFTFDLIKNQGFQNPILSENLSGIKIVKVDSKKMDFILPEPDTFFLAKVAVGILPKHIYESVHIEDLPSTIPSDFVCSGPYKLERIFSREDFKVVSMIRNENYHGKKSFLSKVNLKYFPDLRSLEKNLAELNSIREIPIEEKNKFTKKHERFKLADFTLPQYVALFLNMEREIFMDLEMRKAIFYSSFKDEIIENIVLEAQNIETPIFEGEEKLKFEDFRVENSEGAFYSANWRLDDENRAKRENGERFVRKKNGKTLEINFLTKESPLVFSKIARFLKEKWEKAGATVNLEIIDGRAFSEKLKKRDYDLVLLGETLGYDLDAFSYWHSSEAGESGLNFSNYKSFVVDNFLEQIRTEFDEVEREKKIVKLKEKIAEDYPAIFLYTPKYLWAVDKELKGISIGKLSFHADRFSHIDEWFIHEEKKFYGKISKERFLKWLEDKVSLPKNLKFTK